eukprot:scaffold3656_cov254-Pinguiococcus_pyrenoidosus.AAC.6
MKASKRSTSVVRTSMKRERAALRSLTILGEASHIKLTWLIITDAPRGISIADAAAPPQADTHTADVASAHAAKRRRWNKDTYHLPLRKSLSCRGDLLDQSERSDAISRRHYEEDHPAPHARRQLDKNLALHPFIGCAASRRHYLTSVRKIRKEVSHHRVSERCEVAAFAIVTNRGEKEVRIPIPATAHGKHTYSTEGSYLMSCAIRGGASAFPIPCLSLRSATARIVQADSKFGVGATCGGSSPRDFFGPGRIRRLTCAVSISKPQRWQPLGEKLLTGSDLVLPILLLKLASRPHDRMRLREGEAHGERSCRHSQMPAALLLCRRRFPLNGDAKQLLKQEERAQIIPYMKEGAEVSAGVAKNLEDHTQGNLTTSCVRSCAPPCYGTRSTSRRCRARQAVHAPCSSVARESRGPIESQGVPRGAAPAHPPAESSSATRCSLFTLSIPSRQTGNYHQRALASNSRRPHRRDR